MWLVGTGGGGYVKAAEIGSRRCRLGSVGGDGGQSKRSIGSAADLKQKAHSACATYALHQRAAIQKP